MHVRKLPKTKEVPQEEKLEIELDAYSEPVGTSALRPVRSDRIVPSSCKPGITKTEGEHCIHLRFL